MNVKFIIYWKLDVNNKDSIDYQIVCFTWSTPSIEKIARMYHLLAYILISWSGTSEVSFLEPFVLLFPSFDDKLWSSLTGGKIFWRFRCSFPSLMNSEHADVAELWFTRCVLLFDIKGLFSSDISNSLGYMAALSMQILEYFKIQCFNEHISVFLI